MNYRIKTILKRILIFPVFIPFGIVGGTLWGLATLGELIAKMGVKLNKFANNLDTAITRKSKWEWVDKVGDWIWKE